MNNLTLIVSNDPFRREPSQHNYMKKLAQLERERKLKISGVSDVRVSHDKWCGIFSGVHCNCDPEIRQNGKRIA